MPAFGKFPSFSAFIDSYRKEQKKELAAALGLLPPELRNDRLKRHQDIVEITGTIKVREPDDVDGDHHYRLRVQPETIILNDEHVAADVQRCISTPAQIFVAIRYGDAMGLSEQIPDDELAAGQTLHLHGEWIPSDKAYSHGGEQQSVLHFTHHPVGFTCTSKKCYS